jgi:hypothetical protein
MVEKGRLGSCPGKKSADTDTAGIWGPVAGQVCPFFSGGGCGRPRSAVLQSEARERQACQGGWPSRGAAPPSRAATPAPPPHASPGYRAGLGPQDLAMPPAQISALSVGEGAFQPFFLGL